MNSVAQHKKKKEDPCEADTSSFCEIISLFFQGMGFASEQNPPVSHLLVCHSLGLNTVTTF